MIQPLQRNWCWFHEQREQRAYSAFLEFLLPCLYLHSLKVSQLEKESQEQRERCKMLSAELENANNLHRTSQKSLKDVLEETVLRWKSFGIPECDVEVHATDSGQFLPPNNLKAKERLSDASTTMRNASMGTRGRRKPTSLFFLGKRTKWFLSFQLIDALSLLLDFLPVDEVVMFDVRAVSRFFASPKAWVFHLFKLMDIDSLPTLSSEKQMHPVDSGCGVLSQVRASRR